MAKKASLDILDIEPLEPVNTPASDVKAPKEESAPVSEPEVQKKKQRLKRWIIIAGSSTATILAASAVFWLVAARSPAPVVKPAEKPHVSSEPQISADIANLARFYVDLKDDQGRIRILTCDVKLALSGREKPSRLESRQDVRAAVYRAIRESAYERLVDPMGFQYLKANIFSAMNQLLGLGVVNEVYLTDFLLM